MKTCLILIFFVLICLKTSAQEARYFDTDNKEITGEMFEEKRSTNQVLNINLPVPNHYKLIDREEKGKIQINLIRDKIKGSDSSKTLVIIYHPGKDQCNATGNNNIFVNRIKQLETIHKKAKFMYVYKNADGLESYGKRIKWLPDTDQTIEKLFFKYHYPCSSFVVINKKGDYVSYFGEYPTEYISKAIIQLNP